MSTTIEVEHKTQTILVSQAAPKVSVHYENPEQRIVVSLRDDGPTKVAIVVSGQQRIVVENAAPSIHVVDSGPAGPRGFKGDQGEKGDKGDKGDTGDQGPPGDAEGIETVIFNQITPSDTWLVTHTWPGGYPSVSVVDSGGNVIVGNVEYTSTTLITITFSNPFAGKAYLN